MLAKTNHTERIALFGGSFDPIHQAHLRLASAALEHAQLDQVQFIPAGQPWQRAKLKASPTHRAAMVALAIQGEPRFHLNPIEIEREGETYTIDTLRALPKGPRYFWLLGADQLENFCSWSQWEAIAQQVTFLVACRPQHHLVVPGPLQSLIDQGVSRVQPLPFEPMSTSATRVRENLAQGHAVSDDVCPAVINYITKHHLYQIKFETKNMDIQKQQRAVVDALEEVKAQDIRIFNTMHITGLFDRVVIASATSNRQTRALARNVQNKAKAEGLTVIAMEGEETGEWVLVDLGDIVVHIMQPAIRAYYNLEELWGDKPVRMKLDSPLPTTKKATRAPVKKTTRAPIKKS